MFALKCQQVGHFITKLYQFTETQAGTGSVGYSASTVSMNVITKLYQLIESQTGTGSAGYSASAVSMNVITGGAVFILDIKRGRTILVEIGRGSKADPLGQTAGVGRRRQSKHFPKAKCCKVCGIKRGMLPGKPFLELSVPQKIAATAERTIKSLKYGRPVGESRL